MEQTLLDKPLGNLVKLDWEKALYIVLIILASSFGLSRSCLIPWVPTGSTTRSVPTVLNAAGHARC